MDRGPGRGPWWGRYDPPSLRVSENGMHTGEIVNQAEDRSHLSVEMAVVGCGGVAVEERRGRSTGCLSRVFSSLLRCLKAKNLMNLKLDSSKQNTT